MSPKDDRYRPGFVSLVPPAPAPGEVDREADIRCMWSKLRDAVAARFYPSVPAWDDDGQVRIDRAADTLASLLHDPLAVDDVDAAWAAAPMTAGQS